MKRQRKCIAVLVEKTSKDYQAGILRGIYETAFSRDMNVAVFSVTMPRSSDNYHRGEMTMFTLPNYQKFAGVIYLPDTITFQSRDKDVTEPLVHLARETGLPVVTIDYKIEGLPCYFCDDSEVVKAMVHHLIDKQDRKSVV